MFAKVVEGRPAELEAPDSTATHLVAETQFETDSCKESCGSDDAKATNSDDDNLYQSTRKLIMQLQDDINNPLYLPYHLTRHYVDCTDYCNEYDDYYDPDESLGGLLPLQERLDQIKRFHKDSYQMFKAREEMILKEKSADLEVSSDNINANINVKGNKIVRQFTDDCVGSTSTAEQNNSIACANAEEDTKDREMKLEENVTPDDVEKPSREELDVAAGVAASTAESNDCCISSESDVVKDEVDRLKCTEGKTNNVPSDTNTEEDNTREAAAGKAEETSRLLESTSCASNDEQRAEERMLEALSAANTEDEVMRRIIESRCSNASATDLRQHRSTYKSSNVDLGRSSSEYAIKKFLGDKFPPHQVVSETAIAKEDILRTIKEAKKILTDGPYWDTLKTNVDQAAGDYVKGNSPAKPSDEVPSDEERETVNETKDNSIKVTAKLPNVKIERVVATEPDVVQSNLQRLAEITCPDRPKSLIEIHETIEKITEEKRRIEERKKESLQVLSRKFDEIEKLVVDCNDASYTSDSEAKIPNDDSDSLDEFQADTFEAPLTKSEITENWKVEELERQLASEIEEHKRLMDEYQKMISTDLEIVQETTLEPKATQVCDEASVNEESQAKSRDDKQVDEEFENGTARPVDTASMKVDSESDDSLSDFHEEPERTYIKGKVYDFDEKLHGVR